MPHRFFVKPTVIKALEVHLEGDTAYQLRTVLRLRAGDEIVVLDNSGREWLVELTRIDKNGVGGRIIEARQAGAEPKLQITLYQGTLKAAKFEWILQKGTELGVSEFVPMICQRSVVREETDLEKKRSRWESIIREAAEQSGRGRLPRLGQPVALAEAVDQARAAELILMPWEMAPEPSLKQALTALQPARVALFIGPEGGFTAEEAQLAQTAGAQLVTLGPRLLRAETAALAAVTAIFYALE